MFKLFFVRFRRRDSCQNSIESWLQTQIWLHESALWFIFNSVNVKSISWVVCFCSSSLSDWSSNSQTLKCKTQLSDNPVAVVSSCTGTQKTAPRLLLSMVASEQFTCHLLSFGPLINFSLRSDWPSSLITLVLSLIFLSQTTKLKSKLLSKVCGI